jgi:hypothetical protein
MRLAATSVGLIATTGAFFSLSFAAADHRRRTERAVQWAIGKLKR